MNVMAIDLQKLRPATLAKYQAIQNRYKELYNVERRRLDDVEAILKKEFFLSSGRIYIILNLQLGQGCNTLSE